MLPKNEDNSKNENNPKSEDNLKNEDYPKKEDNPKNEDDWAQGILCFAIFCHDDHPKNDKDPTQKER